MCMFFVYVCVVCGIVVSIRNISWDSVMVDVDDDLKVYVTDWEDSVDLTEEQDGVVGCFLPDIFVSRCGCCGCCGGSLGCVDAGMDGVVHSDINSDSREQQQQQSCPCIDPMVHTPSLCISFCLDVCLCHQS